MKAQSVPAPTKVELHSTDKYGNVYKTPQVVSLGTHMNKSRDKEFYQKRALEQGRELNWGYR